MNKFLFSIVLLSVFLSTGCWDATKSVSESQTPPKQLPKIQVQVNLDIKKSSDNKVVIDGKTNLPDQMIVMVDISSENGYHAQSTQHVQNGAFNTDTFSNSSHSLKGGNYVVEVTTPTANVQPDNVKAIIGKNGVNLEGNSVRADNTFGNMVDVKKSFSIEEPKLEQPKEATVATQEKKPEQQPEPTPKEQPSKAQLDKQQKIQDLENQIAEINSQIEEHKSKAEMLPKSSAEYRAELQKQIDLIQQKQKLILQEQSLLQN